MDIEDDSSESNKIKNDVKYPSFSISIIIIIGLFLLSFCFSFFSLILIKNKIIKINLSYVEYLELFTSGIYLSFSITIFFMENNELNKNNNNNNYNNSNSIFVLFLCLGYIFNCFCENIYNQLQNNNNKYKRKASSFFGLNKNNNINNIHSFNTGSDNNTESLISNELFDNNSPNESKNFEKYNSNEEYYFSINENVESFEKDNPLRYSYDFSKKQNIKKNNIYMFEKLISKNFENKINEHIYNEKNINSIYQIILLNIHKIGYGLYIQINTFEYKYFITICLVIYYIVIVESFYLGITLSNLHNKKREINIYIFMISFIYIISGLLGLIIKYIFCDIFQKIIKFFIIGIFVCSCFNILDNYFCLIHNDDEIKMKKSKEKYFLCFFIFGLILYIFIFINI